MAGESYYPSLYNNMNFSNAGNLADVAKQINTGGYLNNGPNSIVGDSQFNWNLGSTTNQSSPGFFSQERFFGSTDQLGNKTAGWGYPALDLLKSGLGFYLGSQQLGQAEDALAENKRQFNQNYAAQKTLINDQLNWQYQARKDRNASNAGELAQIA